MEDLLCTISKNTIEDKKMVFFSFKSSMKRKRKKEKCGKKRKWRRPVVQATPFLRAKMCCSTTMRFLAHGRCITRSNYFFYLSLIKQYFYLVLNIWYLFNLVPYFISPDSNEYPTSGKGREGKQKRWKAKVD